MSLKVDLHTHTSDDPHDRVSHSTVDLIDQASRLGYDALAVTLHDVQLDPAPYVDYARERGVVLIPGIERTVEGRHLLLINFPREAERVETVGDLTALRQRHAGLVIAPHPFYPISSAVGPVIDRWAHLIDAVEWSSMYTEVVNFNQAGEAWARRHGKPLVGNSDLHRLSQMGTTWSEVDASPSPDAICEAIRNGRVKIRTEPLPLVRAMWLFGAMVLFGLPVVRHLPRQTPVRRPGLHPL